MNKQHTATDSHSQQGFGSYSHGCGGPFSRMFSGKFAGPFGGKAPWEKFASRKAVNIEENDTAFKILLYAAGLSKSNFKISAGSDVLTIAYSAPQAGEPAQNRYTYQEYEPGPFERSFQLNGKVLTESISADYTDGVLTVTLPKNPETSKPAQQVSVN